MDKTIWVCMNKSKTYKITSGWISDAEPSKERSENFSALYTMNTKNFAKCELNTLNTLGVKEGECKQFRFEEVTQ